MEIKSWAGTDAGRKRARNEDNFLIDRSLKLYVVADGMGGHASGEVASAMAVYCVRDVVARERELMAAYRDDQPSSHVEVCRLLEYAVHHACAAIHAKAQQEPEKRGMGTTLVALQIIGTRGFIAYVGDSRIYLLRAGAVYQLTEDHSLMNELIRQGKLSPDDFDNGPYREYRNTMTRAVGVEASVDVDTLDFEVLPGDAFLLCSDGLYGYLQDSDIVNFLALPDTDAVPARLIDLANTRGGKDNITALVVQVSPEEGNARAAEINLTIDALRNVHIFRPLSYQQLVRILNLTRQRTIAAGEAVFREHEAGNELFVLLRGRVQLSKGGLALTELSPGANFGEMSLLDANPRSATAIAIDEVRVLTMTRQAFYDILRKDTALAVKLLSSLVEVLAKRLRKTTSELFEARKGERLPDFTEDLFDV